MGIWSECQFEINSLGDIESRQNYKTVLLDYFEGHNHKLSKLSKHRLERGSVLRILDSKEEEDQALITNAPKLIDHLNQRSSDRFSELKSIMESLGIPFVINHHLVRGLDYYNDTCFEIVSKKLGSTVLAGGRYDGLSTIMGGSAIPGIGWATGIERLSLLLKDDLIQPIRPVFFTMLLNECSVKNDIQKNVLELSYRLKEMGIQAIIGNQNGLGKQLKASKNMNSIYTVIIGEDEVKKGVALVKNMDTSVQEEIALDELLHYIINDLNKIDNVYII